MTDETHAQEGKADETKAPNVKMVPESDLLTVKGALEGQLKKLQEESASQLNQVKLQADGTYSDLLRERTAREQLEKQVQDASEFKAKYETVTKELETVKQSIPIWETKATEKTRDLVALKYGVDPKVLEGKTVKDLETLEEALKIAGKGPRAGANSFYDRGSGQGTPSAQPFSAEIAELDSIRKL